MGRFLGKANYFVFDRRAVARAGRLNLTRVHRRSMEVLPDQIVHSRSRVCQPARHLRLDDFVGHKRERNRIVVAGLNLGFRIVDRPSVESSRRSGLEALDFEAEPQQGLANTARSSFPGPPAGGFGFAGVHDGLEECAGGQNHRRSKVLRATFDCDAANDNFAGDLFGEEIVNCFLAKLDIRLGLDHSLNFELISLLIGLGARRVHRGPFAIIEHPKLNSGPIDGFAHESAESINLAHELAFGNSADGRIATHLPNRIQAGGQQRHSQTHPSRCSRRLRSGMTGSDDDDFVVVAGFGVGHGILGVAAGYFHGLGWTAFDEAALLNSDNFIRIDSIIGAQIRIR